MITVNMKDNEGDGRTQDYPVAEGTTAEQLAELVKGRFWENGYTVRVNGTNVTQCRSTILQPGDRVSILPRKIEGALPISR